MVPKKEFAIILGNDYDSYESAPSTPTSERTPGITISLKNTSAELADLRILHGKTSEQKK